MDLSQFFIVTPHLDGRVRRSHSRRSREPLSHCACFESRHSVSRSFVGYVKTNVKRSMVDEDLMLFHNPSDCRTVLALAFPLSRHRRPQVYNQHLIFSPEQTLFPSSDLQAHCVQVSNHPLLRYLIISTDLLTLHSQIA